ncbi:MAG: phosphatase PAP2 family protein [Candidatus Niyogibacteria bacterium]|nr:phosphatase PAP2 family protein [Candidatus Niyogibacteria bacterium]
MEWDVQIFHFFNNAAGHSRLFDASILFFASYLQYVLVVGFLLFLFLAKYRKQEKFRIFLVTAASIIIARLGVTEIIRFLYHRPRPFLSLHAEKLLSDGQIFYSDTTWSFPSGHSAFFFAMAGAIYLYNKKWGTGFFIAAIVMNVSRIIAGVHYPSDILVGMAVGIIVAYLIFYLIEKKKAFSRWFWI